MTIDEIKRLIREGRYEVSIHAQQERLEDDLDLEEIESAVLQGDLIEDYPTDPRGPSCLIAGFAGAKPIHVVLGWAKVKTRSEPILRMITVYIPQPPKWTDIQTRGAKP